MIRLVQITHKSHGRRVAVVEEPQLRLLKQHTSVYQLAEAAVRSNCRLRDVIEDVGFEEDLVYDPIYTGQSEWKLLPPIDHPQLSRCYVMGTGLTHKGSAENRQSMHTAAGSGETVAGRYDHGNSGNAGLAGAGYSATDSMKMFQIGLEGGRPSAGAIGAAPEWFYKGVGTILRAHNKPLTAPSYALDGGEEAEIAGVYFIGPDGTPFRIGLVQGNEFSDHILESENYLYLAPSKLRECALGPELIVEPKFDDVAGYTEIERDGKVIWHAAQATGERSMCHSLSNLEHHHFKYGEHRRPGDVHVHFLGADMFSFKDRLRLADGDVMIISFEGFGRPLRNSIRIEREPQKLYTVKEL